MRLTSVFTLLVAAGLAPGAQAANLMDAYRLAVENDPQIRIARANYMAAREASPQAWAQYLPQISGSYESSQTDSESSAQAFGTFVIPSTTTDTESDGWSVSLNQTIFNWGTIQQIDAAGSSVAQAEAQYHAAQQELIVRVAEAYFNVLAAKDTLESARANREAIGKQLEQTRKRFEVGLIAVTDVQESQAAYDQAVAEEIAAERQVTVASEALGVILGEYMAAEQLASPDEKLPLIMPEPADPEAWVKTALEQNLELVAARFGLEAAQQTVDARRAGHYPSLDLVASRSDSSSVQERVVGGVPQNPINSDNEQTFVALQLSVPIFSGGATQSRVREAAARASAAQAEVQQATRVTVQETRSSYLGVTSEISRVKALRQAVQSAKTALEATQAGFEVGTRTTVDVLVAQGNLFQAQTNYARAKYDYILNLLNLRAAAGTLDEKDLEQVNGWLK